jgi:hypothetical protein
MPAAFVRKQVEDFIFYYYAKLVIAPSAGFKGNYRFVVDAYKRLKAGTIRMSDYDRELVRLAEQSGVCAYCGTNGEVCPSQIVPQSLGGPVGIHNLVLACEKCDQSKNGRDLVDWWRHGLGRSHDTLPRIAIGLYLKIAYEFHRINFTLNEKCTDLVQLFPILAKSKAKEPKSERAMKNSGRTNG